MKGFKVGDFVYITAKVESVEDRKIPWNGIMINYLNDGIKYEVRDVTVAGKIRLDNSWYYLPECLSHAEVIKKKVIKKKKKPLSLQAAFLDKVKSSAYHGALCSYSVMDSSGGISHNMNDVCHYRIQQPYGVKGIILDVNRAIKDLDGDKKLFRIWKRYANYVMRVSPWNSAFKTKTLASGFKSGVLLDVSKSISVIGGACIALRNGTEMKYRLTMFDFCMRKKMSPNVAFLMSIAFNRIKNTNTFELGTFGTGHDVFSDVHSVDTIMDFMANGYDDISNVLPATKYSKKYKIFDAIGKVDRDNCIYNWFLNNTKTKNSGNGWNVKKICTKEEVLRIASLVQQMINDRKEIK
jgi:hypothetical protein